MKEYIETKTSGKRLSPEQREQQILERAIEYFATHGFSASTRELAKHIGITQPLLYRYFPTKDVLIERVYNEVYCWNNSWNTQIHDPSLPIREKLIKLYISYAHTILNKHWIRIFIFAGLNKEDINKKYLTKLREHFFIPVLKEIHQTFNSNFPEDEQQLEQEIELIWSLHANIFYLGVRKWVYSLDIPENIDQYIAQHVDILLAGLPKLIDMKNKDRKNNS